MTPVSRSKPASEDDYLAQIEEELGKIEMSDITQTTPKAEDSQQQRVPVGA